MDQQDSFPCTEEAQANYLSEQGCVTCLVYYGRSIKEKKGNVSDAQKVVQAILKHSMSADRKPSHEYCPKGETYWCGRQRDQARKHAVTTTIILRLLLW